MGPDPLTDHLGFLTVSGGRVVLIGLAVLVGRPWPLAAVVLLLPLGPWNFEEGVATSDLTWMGQSARVKLLPTGVALPATLTYAYLSGLRTERVWPAPVALGLAALTGALVVTIGYGGTPAAWITMGSGLLAVYAVPYLLGVLRRRLLQQRARAASAGQAQARLRERARIAHDMHDSLGHDLALIAVRAAGLEVAPGLSPAQARAAGELRTAAAEATDRLREIIGLLREDAAPLTPVGESVRDLVERARASGMAITLDLASGPVPALAHRVVQEGLTNAAKHAPGAAVRVSVSPTAVAVRNGPPRGHRPPVRPGGLGLTALRERVRLAGGTLEAGRDGEGYALLVEISGGSRLPGGRDTLGA
jgi:signal transduction histidine kinase